MPLISTPAGSQSVRPDSPEVELLRRAGILKADESLESRMIGQMQEVGLSTKNVLSQLALLMCNAESDATKLAAVREALKLYMHPAFVQTKAKEERAAPIIQFQINTPAGAQTSINLGGILRPQADKLPDPIDVPVQKSDSW